MEIFERIKKVSTLSKASRNKVADILVMDNKLRQVYKGYAKLIYEKTISGLKVISVTPIKGVPEKVKVK